MKINNEAKIGILVVIVLIILVAITWEAGDFDFTPEGYYLKIHFKNIDGIALNAPVTVNGFEVGRVDDIQLLYGDDSTVVELTLWLDHEAKIHEGSEAIVKNLGFMGEKYVALTSGDDEREFLKDGEIIKGREPGSFEEIMSDGEIIAKNLREISTNVNERLRVNSETIDKILYNVKVSSENIASISTNVDERLKINKMRIDDLITQFNLAAHNMEEMTYDLKLNPWKLMYKEPRKVIREKDKQ
jgi:phospholipid/cholesterol/gamma-HCH transport system substrate-binding protein